VVIAPQQEINVSYARDMRALPLPPFAKFTYWWRVEDSAGNELITDPREYEYTDDRFVWEELGDEEIVVHWIAEKGDPVFGQAALDIARSSVQEINVELRAPVPRPISIYIYDVQDNLNTALAPTGQTMVVGQANPELGVVVVVVPNGDGYTSRMERYIPHEITHLLIYQLVTPTGYRYVPEWLDEGLATANERLPTPELATTLEEARVAGRLLSLEGLCYPFPPNATYLAYAQSGSVVRFLREQYGAERIHALLTAYANGAGCESGVQDTLNISLTGLDTAWRASLEPQAPWKVWAGQAMIWGGLWLLSLLIAVPMIGGLRRKRS
jgi:hypothetical protein